MNRLPFNIGPLHFVGIGGIGMSGLAEVVHAFGYQVQGSDLRDGPQVKRLRARGIEIFLGQQAEHLGDACAVVLSSAITEDNPEWVAARARGLVVLKRSDMLAEAMRAKWPIAVSGTHGKTTTTSLIAAVIDAAGCDPTVINGGVVNAYGSNARLGRGSWMVVEADESDGSFLRLPAIVAVVTNIDPEHLDYYGSFERVCTAYETFISNLPFYGIAILCADHPQVQALIARLDHRRRVITYGTSPQADIYLEKSTPLAEGTTMTVRLRTQESEERWEDLFLSLIGQQNAMNALAAIAVAQLLEISPQVVRRALADFAGIERRFTIVDRACDRLVIDDYAHHPVEIAAVLAAMRAHRPGRVVAVVQPHRYTRLAALFEEFCSALSDADVVWVSAVYAAGEEPIAGVDHEALVQALRQRGHRQAAVLADLTQVKDCAAQIFALSVPEDTILCLGAGSISGFAHALPAALRQIATEAT